MTADGSSVAEDETQVLVEQTAAVAPERLGDLVGHVSRSAWEAMDSARCSAMHLD